MSLCFQFCIRSLKSEILTGGGSFVSVRSIAGAQRRGQCRDNRDQPFKAPHTVKTQIHSSHPQHKQHGITLTSSLALFLVLNKQKWTEQASSGIIARLLQWKQVHVSSSSDRGRKLERSTERCFHGPDKYLVSPLVTPVCDEVGGISCWPDRKSSLRTEEGWKKIRAALRVIRSTEAALPTWVWL